MISDKILKFIFVSLRKNPNQNLPLNKKMIWSYLRKTKIVFDFEFLLKYKQENQIKNTEDIRHNLANWQVKEDLPQVTLW